MAAAGASKLCHICGCTFPKSFLPVHQRQCIKRYTNSQRTGLNSVEFLGFQEKFAGSQPCANCMQTVPRNRLSAHLRVCKGTSQQLDTSTVRDRKRAEYAMDVHKTAKDLPESEFRYASPLSLVPPIPRGSLKSESIESVAVAADGPIKRQAIPKRPLERQSPKPEPEKPVNNKKNTRDSLVAERAQETGRNLEKALGNQFHERLSLIDRSINIDDLPLKSKHVHKQEKAYESDASDHEKHSSQYVPNPPDDDEQNNYADDVIRIPCQQCGRKFAEDRLNVHVKACKVASKTRKVFDAGKARVRGTDLEKYTEISKHKNPAAESIKLKKNNWRAKHQNFIQMVRAARDPNAKDTSSFAAGNQGGFDPYADYVQCEHCGRRFNEDSAKRHIPVCASAKAKQRFASPQKTIITRSQNRVSANAPAKRDEMLKKRTGFKPPKPKSSTLSL
ncbi:hypothetical protein BJ742DRAFT_791863, partial [Cladochytrium replicatum]